ncbi:GPI inositol deacylase [Saxophila tyrrhenica]|uniref:GPI inositol-deacylase n=1 Tax=Saxophila tyrrhenica TaxID=1690608 RepID=A0AAV9PT35_9PEZI|nr:GPI inositol deacylase [Saxophila tyrrhenica]
MRRRPSGSQEDEDGLDLATRTTPDGNARSDEMTPTKDLPRGEHTLKPPDSKSSREARRNSAQEHHSTWSPCITAAEKSPLANGHVRSKDTPEPTEEPPRHSRAHVRSPWRCSFLTLAASACSILLLLAIAHAFLTRQLDPKGCAMSYMRPSFSRFADFDTEHTRFASKYSLYLYREGGVDEDTRVKGIPVLFIPGNAGSYKQMRPIAAEAANYFQDQLRGNAGEISSGKRPLDFFTVDFNEELTAFHGQTMLDQAEYLNEAVAYILALYHNPQMSLREPGLPDPKSVIILGHSMGGVVARTMLRMPNYQEKSINTIVTLSAPHARPPVSFDAAMVAAYQDINTFWRESYFAGSSDDNPLADVTLVSVAGGGLDTMIASEYSSLTSLVPDTHGFTVFTSSIPNVWTGMDHLAIMWCNQFRRALVRAIFDVVDARRPAQTRAQPERVAALRRRLLTGMEPVVEKEALNHEPTTFLSLEHSSTTMMAHGDRLELRSLGHGGKTRAHVMPVPSQPESEGGKFTLMTNQRLDTGDEEGSVAVFLCSVSPPPTGASVLSYVMDRDDASGSSSGSTRLACKNAAIDVSLLPASTNESINAFDDATPFSYLQYEVADMSDNQFVAVIERSSELSDGWLFAEFSSAKDSSILVSKGHHQLLLKGMKRKLPPSRPMMTELKIPEVHSTLFAYRLDIDRRPCQGAPESFAPLLRQYIQEPYESKYFVNTQGGNINVHGISPYMPPPLSGGGASEGLSLQLWTDPTCNSTVKVTLSVDVLGSAGKLVMRYRTVLAAMPVLVVAIVMRKQFKVYDATGVFVSFSQSMDQCLRTSLPMIFTAMTFLGIALSKATKGPLARQWLSTSTGTTDTAVDFTINDLLLGTSDPFFWFLVPLFGLIAVGICITANYFVLMVTNTFEFIYTRIRSLTSRTDDSRRSPTGFTTTTTQQRIYTTGVLLLLVATVIPYQFAYLVLCMVQLMTSVRAVRAARDISSTQTYNLCNYTHATLLLMLWILPLNLPTLVVWMHNLSVQWLTSFSTHHNLLCILPFILLVETQSTGNMVPRVTSRIRFLTNTLTFALALYAAIYGVTYAYRLHYIVNALCAWLFVLHCSDGGSLSLARWVPSAFASACNTPATSTGSHRGYGRNTKKRP